VRQQPTFRVNDPVLKRALAALRMDDELTVRYQLDALQRRLDGIAAMVPHQPFAEAEIRAARLIALNGRGDR
jgi:hypothetical protein